jgi:predicted RNase H-like nuclease
MTEVLGIDGCREGWLVVQLPSQSGGASASVFRSMTDILQHYPKMVACAVDIPIGLPEQKAQGGREADRMGRKLLGKRSSALFSPPLRAWLELQDYEVVRKLGVSRQSFLIWPKIRDLDTTITPDLQERIVEAHPEMVFSALHGEPLVTHKRSQLGQNQRIQLLEQRTDGFFSNTRALCEDLLAQTKRKYFGVEDILDACALAWVAWKYNQGKASRVPSAPPCDERGLRMEIWY